MTKSTDSIEQNKPGKWVTMGDVAKKAGVAPITVSRVLRTPDKVKPGTRDLVLAAVRELGYVPDEIAGNLSSRKSNIVGALVSSLDGSTFASTVDGLSSRLRKDGYHLLLATSEYSPQNEAEIIPALLSRRPAALVLTSTEHTQATRALLINSNIPIIELWELPEQPIDCAVGFSNVEAGAAVTQFVFEQGYKRPAIVGDQSIGNTRAQQRLRGYESVVRDRNEGQPRIFATDEIVGKMAERGAKGLSLLLEKWPDTDAVICTSDSVALGVLSEARRRGLSVPGEIAVVGFGDFEFAGDYGLELTTVRIPGFEIGTRAAELILERIKSDISERQSIDVGFEIVSRSTA